MTTAGKVRDIAEATKRQDAASSGVATDMGTIVEKASENQDAVSRTAGVVHSLENLAGKLQAAVAHFSA